jgi:hypothetical protein
MVYSINKGKSANHAGNGIHVCQLSVIKKPYYTEVQ